MRRYYSNLLRGALVKSRTCADISLHKSLEVDDLLKILTYKVLEETETHDLCISLVIPVSGYSQLTEKINDFNWRIINIVSSAQSTEIAYMFYRQQ